MNLELILEQMSEDTLSIIALPIFFASIFLEVFLAKKQNLKVYQLRDSLTSVAMLVFSALIEILPKILAFIVFYQLHEISPLRDVIERQWWAWFILFFADDLCYYCFHRANHEVRFFWAGHVPHHSSVYLNLATALRQGVGERSHKFLFWLALPLLGFDALMIFTMISISLIYQFFIHTELLRKLPRFIELIFNTPSHHRVHHASNIRYLDCNHGGILIIWDKLFATFSEEIEAEPPIYGLTTNLDTYNPLRVAFQEYHPIWRDMQRCTTFSHKISYLTRAPGWSHDGPDKRARTLRKQLFEAVDS